MNNYISLKSKIKWTISFALLLLSGFYLFAYESYRYNSCNDFFGIILIVIGLIMIQSIWYKLPLENHFDRFFYGLIAIALLASLSLVMKNLREKFIDQQINQFGVLTSGKVIGFESKKYRGETNHFATISYYCGNTKIIHRTDNNKNIYNIGDTIRVIFSREKPEIFKIIE